MVGLHRNDKIWLEFRIYKGVIIVNHVRKKDLKMTAENVICQGQEFGLYSVINKKTEKFFRGVRKTVQNY